MKKSDILLVSTIFGIVVFFFLMTLNMPAAVRIYPYFIMVVLLFLNFLYLGKCVVSLVRTKKISHDIRELFLDFLPKQFFVILLLSVAYIPGINVLGFYPATALYLIAVLIFLRVRILYIAITVAGFACLIYGAFSKFLNVPLPGGIFN